MRAVLHHRQQLQRVDPKGDLLRALDSVVGDLNTQPLCVGASQIWSGVGSPEGIVLGSPGDLYLRTDGTAGLTLYGKATGKRTTTGWVAREVTGTWTPVDASGAGLAFTVGTTAFVKSGVMVDASAFITYPVTADGTGAIIGGLPYTAAAGTNSIDVGCSRTSSGLAFDPLVVASTTSLQLRSRANVQITNVQLSAFIVNVTVRYRTTA